VLVDLSVMEQRYQAVMAVVQDGCKVVEVADRLGVARQSVHNWIARYEAEGLPALADRSHRPESCAHQSAPDLEALTARSSVCIRDRTAPHPARARQTRCRCGTMPSENPRRYQTASESFQASRVAHSDFCLSRAAKTSLRARVRCRSQG
jgi:transposase-like protein